MSSNVYSDTLHDKFILEVQLSNKKIVQQLIYNYIYTLNVSNFARKTLQKKLCKSSMRVDFDFFSELKFCRRSKTFCAAYYQRSIFFDAE